MFSQLVVVYVYMMCIKVNLTNIMLDILNKTDIAITLVNSGCILSYSAKLILGEQCNFILMIQ